MTPIPRITQPWALPVTEQRLPHVLRLLARLEFALVPHIQAVVFPDVEQRTMLQTLENLHRRGLVWREVLEARYLPHALASRRGRRSRHEATLYGLSPAGRALLEAWGLEEGRVLRRAVVRDPDDLVVRKGHLAHDLEVVDWCVSVIVEAALCRPLYGLRCELEYIIARDEDGQPLQRFDALLLIDLDAEANRRHRARFDIPWAGGVGGQTTLRIALEVDRATEPLRVHAEKARMYQRLRAEGHYQATLGGDVLPVVVCPSTSWARRIAATWAAAAPEGSGLVSMFGQARHAAHGALWGQYTALDGGFTAPGAAWGFDLRTWQVLCGDRPLSELDELMDDT